MLRRIRIARYRWISSVRLNGATVVSPVLAVGNGEVEVSGSRLGFWPSPRLFDGCIHLEVRSSESSIEIGLGTIVNNGCVMISEGPGIQIGRDCLIGPGVQIYDSDFHALDQLNRQAPPERGAVGIGDRVFIGASVIICKGVSIGDGAVIGAGSVVVSDVLPRVVVAGNPCRVVGETGEAADVDDSGGTVEDANSPE